MSNIFFRFQAIECFMANIQSIGATESEKPESWDTPAIDYFERLVKGSNRVISFP